MPFKPSIHSSFSLLILCTIFVLLGSWQLQRATEKQQRMLAFESARETIGLPPEDDATEFTRVTIEGSFEHQKHVLADNRVLNGRTGVHVYTPFLEDGGNTILVNRGWLPMAPDRKSVPDIPNGGANVTIRGHIGFIPPPGRRLGETDSMSTGHWPQLVTYPEMRQIQDAMETSLYPQVLFLDPSSPGGFAGRDWKPVFMTPSRHRAYAFQWFALATTAVIAWLLMAVLRGRMK